MADLPQSPLQSEPHDVNRQSRPHPGAATLKKLTEPESEPDTWRIAINEARGHDWYTFDGTLTDLLTDLLSGELHIPLFPPDILHEGATFTPSRRDDAAPLTPPASRSVDTNTIREWARATGYDVPDRGRIPAAIREAGSKPQNEETEVRFAAAPKPDRAACSPQARR
ncbi:Lsr2 family DNA-binding protein [Streptomyces doebereineriae]|uniref:Histone-like nucleoid-structuring protein Lsr2 n=1 Tax=Streptomyces doebereineriae TaxID=3075528 RepID=A0ABU2VIA0_9ACTN|nr:histone-like nucleoid-structuring protein Lsr2 [Streptomyces sp. DSM 41640]MDT0485317.1 histone-like nucleoid-structuring protein Lsr2 [Streptomyces sp. DSM 41640]